ncbi:peptidoglycan-binding protein [Streptomyces bobili]|uniref:peptidoglycan-binding domain-containing protein n=1 Tax=Streptomyces bobili TaxID=67280 RepID=UPI00341A337C
MNDPTDRQGRPGEPVRPQGHGHPCPQCGALRAADNTPSCACAQRASDALRDTREAEVAAAESFDPLRIRPYVELGEAAGDGGEAGDVTMPLPAARPTPPGDTVSDATMTLRAVAQAAGTAPVPTPLAPSGSTPSDTDLSLFEAGRDSGSGPYDDGEAPHGRRRRTLLIASTGAAVAVIAAAGFASGMFSYETPTRDRAAAEEVRAAVPDASTSAPPESPSASRSASPSAASSAPASPSESASASPSATESSASPSPSRTTEPSPSAPTTQTTGSLAPGNGAEGGSGEVTVLRRGDRGPEVTELQLRLRQLYLFNDEANGMFGNRVEEALRNYQWSRGIQGDELGEYGPASRTSLESETKEP